MTDSENNVSLKEYFERALLANEKALDLARAIMDARLEGMNEFRDQLKDQASRFVTREELSLMKEKIYDELRTLNTAKDRTEGKASMGSVYLVTGIAVIGLFISIISVLINLMK